MVKRRIRTQEEEKLHRSEVRVANATEMER